MPLSIRTLYTLGRFCETLLVKAFTMSNSARRSSSVAILLIVVGGSLVFMVITTMQMQPMAIPRMRYIADVNEPHYATDVSRGLGATKNAKVSSLELEPYKCTPRPQKVQNKVNRRHKRGRNPLIYFHEGPKTHASLKEMYFSGMEPRPCFECDWTDEKERLVEADVVVVLYRKEVEYQKNKMERVPTKYCGQLFVMLQLECPNNIDPELTPEQKHWNTRIFDISSTYRLDSDLPRPYKQHVLNLMEEAKNNYLPVQERDSEFPVAWIASRCDTTNERMAYVKELMKHIGVKSYGECLHNADMDTNRQASNWSEGADLQIGRHKFYLAFENSNCDYYVSEKLYRPLKVGVIPVVMGAPQARIYVPNNHSALFVNDFPSPKALAERMHEINNSNALFEHYTSFVHHPEDIDIEFRNLWLRKKPPHACQLCNLIKSSFGKNFKGVPKDHWTSCEQQHGTWKTNFQPIETEDGVVRKLKITGH